MIGGIAAFLAIIFFVMAHEAGHFIAAKATGMKATEFFFGFGPRLFSFRRGETEYGVKALPFGGYVRILGMNSLEDVDPADAGRAYRDKKFWQKSVAVLSGVAMNFLIAYVMFFGVIVAEGVPQTASDGLPVASTTLDQVLLELDDGSPSPASEAGLQRGDRIVELDGRPITEWDEAASAIEANPGETVEIVVMRDGAEVTLTAALASRTEEGKTVGYLGVAPEIAFRSVGVFEAMGLAGEAFGDAIGATFDFLGRLIQPASLARLGGALVGNTDIPDEIRPVSPIGMVNIGTQAESLGIANLLWLLASVNVVLGTLNVLPLYPLDGGHFAVAVYEKLSGRVADVRKLAPVAAVVIALVAFVGLVGVVLDVIDPIRLPG
ncbi:MAG TPA: M50 family metallopeptidase [Acidimicrobiia bacterium]|jgi:membrane-associated protease RseP (regulator of RpoE activity)|nr:M50 family metallopeptidase [Acidimicrobiia bacterium]